MNFMGFLAQEDTVDLGKVHRHSHLGLHVLGRAVEDRLPEWLKELAVVLKTTFHDGPYFTTEDFGSHIWIPGQP
jgi:hypothetical protein